MIALLKNIEIFTYPNDIHFAYIAPFSGFILILRPVRIISSLVTADNEFNADATVLFHGNLPLA